MNDQPNRTRYWRRNLLYVKVLLAVWLLVSYGFGILWVDQLDPNTRNIIYSIEYINLLF